MGDEQLKALLNIFFNIFVCLFATWLGMLLAKQL
jgi:fluoride ion exporter CrcB/FEX